MNQSGRRYKRLSASDKEEVGNMLKKSRALDEFFGAKPEDHILARFGLSRKKKNQVQ